MTRALACWLLIAAACSAPNGATMADLHTIHGESMVYGGAATNVNLLGPSGQLVELQADGTNIIQWAPTDKRAMEVEVRIRLMAHLNPSRLLNDPPLLRASLYFGHGKLTWQEPFFPPPFATSEVGGKFVYVNYAIPARGVVWRVDARELKVLLNSPGTLSGAAAYPGTTVMVSFQPCGAMERPVFPQVDFAVTLIDPVIRAAPFPQGANEWRLYDADGLPFASGNVTCSGLEVESYTVPRAALADFRPIPFHAVGWVSPDPCYAQYR